MFKNSSPLATKKKEHDCKRMKGWIQEVCQGQVQTLPIHCTGLAPGEVLGKVVIQHSGEEIAIKLSMDC